MKLQILPNWCKKLGLFLFIVFSFLGGGDDFIEGFISGFNAIPYESAVELSRFSDYFGENLIHFFEVLGIFGMLIYMLSKEKIEDDYINMLRSESFQLTAIVGLLISILLYSISADIKLTLDYFISIFMMFYLVTFFIKKRIY